MRGARGLLVGMGIMTGLSLLFIWPAILQGKVAFPGDLLSGAYFPWMQSPIPIKNPLISDVFSQIFPWKSLVIESFSNFKLPLWNPYTLSGYPLLANYHSGAWYPGNLLLFGDFISGWNRLLWWQLVGCGVFMYAYLKSLKLPITAAVSGAITYTYGGFSMVWWQLAHAGQVMAWLPFTLLAINKRRYDAVVAGIFLLGTAGHLQTFIYALLMLMGYGWLKAKSGTQKLKLLFAAAIGCGLLTMLILPFRETLNLSVRNVERYIEKENFGLLPLGNMVTLLAPDFLGHPSTRNYWGPFNYQETVIYSGVLGIVAIAWAVSHRKILIIEEKYWLLVVLLALLLAFDTPIGRSIYNLNIPGLATSSAARISVAILTGTAVLVAGLTSRLKTITLKNLVVALVILIGLISSGLLTDGWRENILIGLRNLIYPGIILASLASVMVFRQKPISRWIIVGLILADLFRFGMKYNPWVSKDLVFQDTDVTNYLTKDSEFSRIERLDGPILPANTWEYYRLMSASGYDPMASEQYTTGLHVNLNNRAGGTGSRYTQVDNFLSADLAEYGIKNVLARNQAGTDGVMDKFGLIKAKSFGEISVWSNPGFFGLVKASGALDKPVISKFESGAIDIEIEAPSELNIKVLSNFYPGWMARANGQITPISITPENFMSLDVPQGKSHLKLRYFPQSFVVGFAISCISLTTYLASMRFLRSKH